MLFRIISFDSHSNTEGKVPYRYFLQIGPSLKSLRYKRGATHGKFTDKNDSEKKKKERDRARGLAH